ncbi:hypothetical protein F5148DRAFT_104161 [Russula earlei]|uniref:Uncharacterized protein n=1 Tax=Russula earlei TaxID=71964 RepID=A0ACC0U8X5_9AGAM|nr:hypothetical protein F5148DRAFT_104161 [Russula earlei]
MTLHNSLKTVYDQIPSLPSGLAQTSSPSAHTATTTCVPSGGMVEGEKSVHSQGEFGREQTSLGNATINMLPDDALLEIFYFYMNDWRALKSAWHTLVHVCQRWRYVVFGSPRSLNLRLVYSGNRPMSEMLDIWPSLPLLVTLPLMDWRSRLLFSEPCWYNIPAALDSEHRDRICEIDLYRVPGSHWDIFSAAMQKTFPELACLRIMVADYRAPVFPDSFLGGSAPNLRELCLRNSPFPGMKRLLLSSANHLADLSLMDIPHSGYISPEAMGTALSAMTRLETLLLQFSSPLSRPRPASRPRPPLTRPVLPALTHLGFRGAHEYLEVLVAHIDAPHLYNLLHRPCRKLQGIRSCGGFHSSSRRSVHTIPTARGSPSREAAQVGGPV